MIETQPDLAPSLLEELEGEAVRLARAAGGILLEHFRRPLAVEYKSDNRRNPVTEADRRTEAYLREAIGRAFPDHGIVGEEDANSPHEAPDFAWVLDPLDGTTNFLNGLPIFASSIGLLHRGRPVVAAVFVPALGEGNGGSVYHARLGGGTRQDGESVWVSANAEPERGRLSGLPAYYWRLFGFRDGLRQRLGEVRTFGSIAYEMAMTARGTLQYALFNAPRVWDVAGGALLVAEAGGRVLTRPGRAHPWEPLIAFAASPATLEQLRTWRGPILAANGEVAAYMGSRVRQRSLRWWRLRRWAAQRLRGLRGRRNGESPSQR